jgi:hypothetical protein
MSYKTTSTLGILKQLLLFYMLYLQNSDRHTQIESSAEDKNAQENSQTTTTLFDVVAK